MAEDRFTRGWKTVQQINGSGAQAIQDALKDVAPDFARLLVEFAFGDLYSRPGLSLREREIATIAALTAKGDVLPQLKAHIEGGLNVGLSKEEIVEIIMQMAIYSGVPAVLNALEMAREVFAARDASAPTRPD
jgi:4-carboxymuconolactone decarboxylase